MTLESKVDLLCICRGGGGARGTTLIRAAALCEKIPEFRTARGWFMLLHPHGTQPATPHAQRGGTRIHNLEGRKGTYTYTYTNNVMHWTGLVLIISIRYVVYLSRVMVWL